MIRFSGGFSHLRIVGVDPGLADSGYGVIDQDGGALKLAGYSTIRTPAAMPFPERLKSIYDQFDAVLEEYSPEVCALESIFFAKNAKSAFQVGHGRAVFILCAALRGIPVYEYTPPQIKKALTGSGKADKEQIQYMTKMVLGLKEIPQPDHAADAIAVAVCHANISKFQALTGATQLVYGTKRGRRKF